MDRVKEIVGAKLQTLRKQRSLTLQELADLTGVSKSMLGEIERGSTSPTITVLWKIADGLKVPVTYFMQEEQPEYILVRREDRTCLDPADALHIAPIFKYDAQKRFEVFHLTMQAGTTHTYNGHSQGVGEYLFVYSGTMLVTAGTQEFVLNAGDSLFFQGTLPHTYATPPASGCEAYSLIAYAAATAPPAP